MAGRHEVGLQGPLDERAGFVPAPEHFLPVQPRPAQGRGLVPPPEEEPARPRLRPDRRRLRIAALRGVALSRQALVTEWERGTPFLFVPVFLAAGALAYFAADAEPGFLGIGIAVIALGVAVRLSRDRAALHLVLAAALCLALGVLFAKIETWRAGTKVLGGEISTRLTGRVAVVEYQASGRVRLTLDVLATERPALRYAPDRVRVSARSVPEGLRAGDVLVGVARLAPPSGPTRPGGYDFSFESYFDGIGANGFFLTAPARVADAPPAAALDDAWAAIENLRDDLAARIRAAVDGEAEGEIAAALIAGVRVGIPEDVNEALRRTGLAHVLSISGLHMALVAATVMFALRAGFALFPGFASRRPVKKYAAGAALAALAVYLFISGSAVAAERSFLMIGIMLVAVIVDRAALTMRNLALSAVVIIAVSPHEVAGPSFQMSFAATAALIGAYAAWSERRRGRRRPAGSAPGLAGRALSGTWRYALGLAATSLVAGLATAVFGAYHFQRVSPLGLVANLAAMPIVSAIVMPFALVGMLLLPFGLDQWSFWIMGKGLTAMIAVARWFSAMSPVDAVGVVPEGAVLLLTLALVLATLPTTWLRLSALPFLVAGLIAVAARTLPDALVSEDGRLLAIRTDGGALAVNRVRPSAFTMKDWQRALAGLAIDKPRPPGASGPQPQAPGDAPDRPCRGTTCPGPPPGDLLDAAAAGRGFVCASAACVARVSGTAVVAHVADAEAARPFCRAAALIVIDDATARNPCPSAGAAVVTKRDLARRGAASASFRGDAGRSAAELTFAVGEPYRPWHANRAYSREARGLPPYRRAARPETTAAQACGAACADPAATPAGRQREGDP